MWGDVSVPWRQSVRDYMELILDNNDVKVKQAQSMTESRYLLEY